MGVTYRTGALVAADRASGACGLVIKPSSPDGKCPRSRHPWLLRPGAEEGHDVGDRTAVHGEYHGLPAPHCGDHPCGVVTELPDRTSTT